MPPPQSETLRRREFLPWATSAPGGGAAALCADGTEREGEILLVELRLDQATGKAAAGLGCTPGGRGRFQGRLTAVPQHLPNYSSAEVTGRQMPAQS